MKQTERPDRSHFKYFCNLDTRWMDNDVYGHVNNVTYYSYFDTAVNRYLIEQGLLDLEGSDAIGIVAETGCRFVASVAFPDALEVGLRVGRLGNSSVRYDIGIFRRGANDVSAYGHFVHVYVDRQTRKPTPLSTKMRECLGRLV